MTAFCNKCTKRKDCKQICKGLNRYLNKIQSQEGYSERHRRRKEIVYDAQGIEDLGARRAFKIRYNWRIPKTLPDE
jgi:hypothetical protein